MRAFVRVIDAGSFAGAAREMNQSPAVVTRLVADLEEHLGARLINRTTRRLALTDIGEAYLERTRAILTEVEEAEALASSATSEPRGHLRVLAPPAFAVHQLAKHLPAFHEQYPKVTIELAAPGPVEGMDEAFDVTILSVARRPLDGDFVGYAAGVAADGVHADVDGLEATAAGAFDHHDPARDRIGLVVAACAEKLRFCRHGLLSQPHRRLAARLSGSRRHGPSRRQRGLSMVPNQPGAPDYGATGCTCARGLVTRLTSAGNQAVRSGRLTLHHVGAGDKAGLAAFQVVILARGVARHGPLPFRSRRLQPRCRLAAPLSVP